jgi:adenylylsulfate kinase
MLMRGERVLGVSAPVLWMTGLPGAGKTTIAEALRTTLLERGTKVIILDGDTLRGGLCADLGYSEPDRIENVRRLAHLAKLFQQEGYLVIVATISPLAVQRELARGVIGQGFCESYLSTPLAVCRQRDPKGMYARAERGQMQQFTGVSAVYEVPGTPDIVVNTEGRAVGDSVSEILAKLNELRLLPVGL